jgi:PAS domain S-box-containing protein
MESVRRTPGRAHRFRVALPALLLVPVFGSEPTDEPPGSYRALFELSTECEFLVDAALKVRRCNPTASREFGGPGRDPTGVPFLELVAPPSRPDVERELARATDAGYRPEPIAVQGVRPDGSTFPADLLLRELRDGGLRSFAIVVRTAIGEPGGASPRPPSEEQFDLAAVLFAQRLRELV